MNTLFAHPHFLWLLLAVPLAAGVWWYGQQQRRAAARRLGEQSVLGRLLQHVNHNGRFAQNLLWLIALTSLALALARPQWGTQTQMVRQEGLQILFVLDVSPSMMVSDGVGPLNRLEEAKQTIATLMAALPQHEMGIVLFSGSSHLFLPLTRDHATAQTLLATVSPDLIPRPGTAVSRAYPAPVLYIQGTGDPWGSAADVAAMAAVTVRAADPIFVESNHRYDGYQYAVDHPKLLAAFFEQHLGSGD